MVVAGFIFYFQASYVAAAPFTITNFDFNPKNQVSGMFNFTYKLQYNGGAPAICEPTSQWKNNVVWLVNYRIDSDPNFIGLVRTGKFSLSQYSQAPIANLDFSEKVTPPAGAKQLKFTAAVGCERVPGEGVQQQASSAPVCTGGTCFMPGSNQKYSFEIPNPLKGGASDFTSLVKIIAQWIFNLAIPIAVAMIVYSGILFLTAAGEPAKVTKAKEVLKYAVIGLAIILIGSGFVTLIQSILELGGTTPPPTSTQKYSCSNIGCVANPNGTFNEPTCNNSCGTTTFGAVGNICSRDRDCVSGLKCQDTICQRETGNKYDEPCKSDRNCDVGLNCWTSGEGVQIIDGQTLGTCSESGFPGGRIGEVCQKDSDCISGLKCNQICQRKDGNSNGEACLKTSNPSNCKSKACNTVGTATEGVCVQYP